MPKVRKDLPGQRATKATLALQVLLGLKVHRDQQVRQAPKAPRVCKDHRVLRVCRATRVSEVQVLSGKARGTISQTMQSTMS